MHPMVDRPPTTELTVNGGGASSISDTCEDGSNASATEADDKTEAGDIEVYAKLAGPQPMSEGLPQEKKDTREKRFFRNKQGKKRPLHVMINLLGCQRFRNKHSETQDKKERKDKKEKQNLIPEDEGSSGLAVAGASSDSAT